MLFPYLLPLLGLLHLVFASPTPVHQLDRRTSGVEISLRETNLETKSWHFSLVLHSAGTQIGGKVYEMHLDMDNMPVDMKIYYNVEVGNQAKAAHFPVKNIPILAAKGEKDATALKEAVATILKGIAIKVRLPNKNFDNCGDYVVHAVEALKTAGYVSATDATSLENGYTSKAKEVRKATDAGTLETYQLCNPGASGFKPGKRAVAVKCPVKSKAGQKPAANAKTAQKPVAKPKAAQKPLTAAKPKKK